MERQVTELVVSIGDGDGRMAARINALVDGLDELLMREGLMPERR
jgi:hypothetical protein